MRVVGNSTASKTPIFLPEAHPSCRQSVHFELESCNMIRSNPLVQYLRTRPITRLLTPLGKNCRTVALAVPREVERIRCSVRSTSPLTATKMNWQLKRCNEWEDRVLKAPQGRSKHLRCDVFKTNQASPCKGPTPDPTMRMFKSDAVP